MHSRHAVASLPFTFALLPCLFLASSAQGGPPPPPTNVLFGFINGSRTLTYAYPGPDYYLPGDLVVNPGSSLIIEPGVTLQFSSQDTLGGGDYSVLVELTVKGTLVADASSGDSIRFVSVSGAAGQWGQIKVEGPASATFRRVAIRGPQVGINSQSNLVLQNSSISAAATDVVSTGGGSIVNCRFADAVNGVNVSGSLLLRESVITGRGTSSGIGLLATSGVSTAVADSTDPRPTIISNFLVGVQCLSNASLSNVIAHRNVSGFLAAGSTVTARYCTAANNINYGFNFGTDSRILCSLATQNGLYGVYTQFSCPQMSDYNDSWSNPSGNYVADCGGPYRAAFNPFYINANAGDYRLTSGSIFKTYGPW